VRDLDRIREVREFRVTGPQLTSLLVSALVLTGAVFAIGYQLGRLRTPMDLALLEPQGESDRDAGSLLAEMLAEKEQRTLASTAPALAEARAAAEPEQVPEPELAEEPASPALTASDVRAGLVPSDLAADNPADLAGKEEPTPGGPTMVVERSFPEGDEPATAEPEPIAVIEPIPETVAVVQAVAPVELPSAPPGRGYTVQVGAFESLEEAAATVTSLQALGQDVFHVAATVNGTVYHRVRVGLFASKDAAAVAAKELEGATPHGTYVTEQP